MLRTGLRAAVLLVAALGSAQIAAGARHDLGYDPKADPFVQYHRAIAAAEAQGKLVLIIAGGDWCSWCYVLERFLDRNAEVKKGLEDAFVTMKVYVGDENYNEFFFSQLPEARGAPHFWIVSPERRVLSSQPTVAFERGRSGYDKREFLDFIARWKSDHAQMSQMNADEQKESSDTELRTSASSADRSAGGG